MEWIIHTGTQKLRIIDYAISHVAYNKNDHKFIVAVITIMWCYGIKNCQWETVENYSVLSLRYG